MAETQAAAAAGIQTAVGTMGESGTINITSQMMNDAMNAITNYKGEVQTAYNSLVNAMGEIPANFKGAAANGFNKFYSGSIAPMLEKGGNLEKMLDSLYDICKSALEQLPGENGIDASLAQINNQSAGGTGAGAGATPVQPATDGAGT